MQNESIYYNVDALQEALQKRRQITFKYFQYNTKKGYLYRHEGSLYTENPVCLIYSNEYYYLVTYSESEKKLKHYRVDRMDCIEVLKEPIVRNKIITEFDAVEYSKRAFSMYGGEEVAVSLLIKEDIAAAVIDRFGKDVVISPVEDDKYDARVRVVIMKTVTFYGWLAQFGTKVKIVKPESLAVEYREFLEEICGVYG